ncbi:transcriptional repressor [Dactylosporangium sp. NPDC050688]|uniref:Fur family transcriptional regulator n=1 Tax=Dactylosporangium sp. NPDC050688 TaxID=3157217 RepID=UPI00340093CF
MEAAEPTDRASRAWHRMITAGARRTLARVMVIDVLAGTAGHLSIGTIHHAIAAIRPEVNLSTVHRTIAFLVGLGVAHVLQRPGEALYGLNERPHIHAVCETCGTHTEIPTDALAPAMTAAQKAVQHEVDFEVGTAGLALFGRCRKCAAQHP